LHMATLEPPLITGIGLTETVTVAVLLQPAALVPVTVYVIVDVGLAVTLAPVVADNPVDGDQLYVEPPVAVKPVEKPLQIATLEPPLITGIGLIVTVTVAVLLQPAALVPVTV
jgi:hypothetical protein